LARACLENTADERSDSVLRHALANRFGSRVIDVESFKSTQMCALSCYLSPLISSLSLLFQCTSSSLPPRFSLYLTLCSWARYRESLYSTRIIVCGGDWMVQRVLEEIELLPGAAQRRPLVGVLPLGDGNGTK